MCGRYVSPTMPPSSASSISCAPNGISGELQRPRRRTGPVVRVIDGERRSHACIGPDSLWAKGVRRSIPRSMHRRNPDAATWRGREARPAVHHAGARVFRVASPADGKTKQPYYITLNDQESWLPDSGIHRRRDG